MHNIHIYFNAYFNLKEQYVLRSRNSIVPLKIFEFHYLVFQMNLQIFSELIELISVTSRRCQQKVRYLIRASFLNNLLEVLKILSTSMFRKDKKNEIYFNFSYYTI